MSDKNDNKGLTSEETVAAVRKKRAQNFKLHVEDYGVNESAKFEGDKPSDFSKSEDIVLKESGARLDEKHSEKNVHAKEETQAENLDQDLTLSEPENGKNLNKVSETIDAVINSYSDEEKRKIMDLEDKESLKAYRLSVKKRCKEKARRNGCMFRFVWFVMVVFVAVMLGMFFIRGTDDMLAISRGVLTKTMGTNSGNGNTSETDLVSDVSVDIPRNATLDEVANILHENGVIKEPMFFKLYASLTKAQKQFLEGRYKIKTNMDYEAILNFLIYNTGKRNTVSVPFTEGMGVRQIAKLLEEKGVCKMDKFLDECNSDKYDENYEFIKKIGNASKRYYKLEGYLFPDTYTFFVNDDVDSVVRKFLDNFYKKIYIETRRYEGYSEEMTIEQYANLKGMSVDRVINMASMVQAEAADEHDMYIIASIFYNRLATDATGGVTPYGDSDVNLLQSDATVYYPYTSKVEFSNNVKGEVSSSYNTYKIKDLPPGPICNPGEKAIMATLKPAYTDYYFFCHKSATKNKAAVPYYATTYAKHLENEVKAGLRK